MLNLVLMLIVFEGADRVGKTTNIQNFKDHILKRELTCIVIKYPDLSEGKTGDILKNILEKKVTVTEEERVKLFIENRTNTLEYLLECLHTYNVVILDRYVYSAIAYIKDLSKFTDVSEAYIKPDLLVYLHEQDVSNKYSDDQLFESKSYQTYVLGNFNKLLKNNRHVSLRGYADNVDTIMSLCIDFNPKQYEISHISYNIE